MIIGCDIDGVLRDIDSKLKEVYSAFNQEYKPENTVHYDLDKHYPNGKEIYNFLEDNADEIYGEAKPYSGAIKMCEKLKSEGHLINLITSAYASTNGAIATIRWLDKNKIPYDALCFARYKWHVFAHIYLDDCTENLIDIAKHTIYSTMCFDRRWNKDWKGIRIKTHNEFLGMVEMLRTLAMTGWVE